LLRSNIRITSGYRSFSRNSAVYAARNQKATKSRHSSGQAADITITGMTGVAIAKLAIAVEAAHGGIDDRRWHERRRVWA